MPPLDLSEIRSLRDRVASLENRLREFERTVLWMFGDILEAFSTPAAPSPTPMLKTPSELVFLLRTQHPDLEAHPTLWRDLEALLVSDRRALNGHIQQEVSNCAITLRTHMEALLHPLALHDHGNPEDPAD